jgi:hypothetical protein
MDNNEFAEFLKTVSRAGIKHCIISEDLVWRFVDYFVDTQGFDMTGGKGKGGEISDGTICSTYCVSYEYKKG